jgi:DNA-binding transcriptional regulator YhcF (GntR family)
MLKIINDLVPFFKDYNRKINVREYARLVGISPPTASKLLGEYEKEGLLLKEEFRNFIFYSANSKNLNFKDLEKIYQRVKND